MSSNIERESVFGTIRAMASAVNYEFVDKVPEDHHCTICKEVLTNPVLIECCGQHFCGACLDHWLTKEISCPACRNKNIKFIKSLHMKRKVHSLKIYCLNRSKGCDKITTLGECNQHLEKCLFVEVSCTKICGERMLRKELEDHEDNKCPNRLVLCQYCNAKGMYREITANSHIDKCPHFPISCPNSCGHEKIQRKNLADHQKVCPLEPVKCPFFEAGCTEMIPRKDLAAHKASNTEHHLELVMTETVTFKQKAAAEKESVKHEAKIQQQQLSLRFAALAFCVTKQLGAINSSPQNTQAAINNINSSLETMSTMLAPGDTRYELPLVKVAQNIARSASFYITPGYKMYVTCNAGHYMVYLEKGKYDHQLKWPMPELDIELSTTENIILYRVTICARCVTPPIIMNRLEGDRTEQDIPNPRLLKIIGKGDKRDILLLTVREHNCKQRAT